MMTKDWTLQQMVNLGALPCSILKNIYFADEHWSQCATKVSEKFSKLKSIARKFYSDKTEFEMIMELSKYSEHDIKEMMESST